MNWRYDSHPFADCLVFLGGSTSSFRGSIRSSTRVACPLWTPDLQHTWNICNAGWMGEMLMCRILKNWLLYEKWRRFPHVDDPETCIQNEKRVFRALYANMMDTYDTKIWPTEYLFDCYISSIICVRCGAIVLSYL